MSVYSVIKSISNDKHITIHRIERDLNLTNGLISKWDNSMPRADTLQNVADYLGVTTTFILNKSREAQK